MSTKIPTWIRDSLVASLVITSGAFVGTISLGWLFAEFVESMNLAYTDSVFQRMPADTHEKKSSVVVVEIDDATLDDPERGGLGRWQEFKRRYYAEAIDRLFADGAMVVGLDVLLSEPSEDPGDDIRLANALAKYRGRVTLGFYAGQTAREHVFPLEIFRDQVPMIGFFNEKLARNGTIYATEIERTLDNSSYEHFSLAVARQYYQTVFSAESLPAERSDSADTYRFVRYGPVSRDIPYAQGGFAGSFFAVPRTVDGFEHISFRDVLSGNYPRASVRNSIVLIGATATALQDRHRTAVGTVPGVYVHASSVDAVLRDRFVSFLPADTEWFMLGLSIFLLAALGFFIRNILAFGIVVFLAISGFRLTGDYFLREYGLLFSAPVAFLLGYVLVFVGTSVYRYLYEDAGKRLLQDTLSQYLAKDLVRSVLDNYESVKLGGARREIVSFFSDIEGFTAFAETRDPEEFVTLLGIYLRDMSDIILDRHGYVNKYEGDAIMALWGAFGTGDSHANALDACEAALSQQRAVERLNANVFAKHDIVLRVRMGINIGHAIVGNIGSLGKKIEFTALGDSVNLASRLEGINKVYRTRILVSEAVKEQTAGTMVFRRLDRIRAKGKQNSVRLYELVGKVSEVSAERLAFIARFEAALERYDAGDFAGAGEDFASLGEKFPDDGPTATLLARSREFEKTPPESWDGAFVMTSK
jgi:class 3 adenylate cyclase/CHASE2 domain-containing sensor protein